MSSLRIVVAGMVAGTPGQGGAAWAVLQYVLGLGALGHEVALVEPVAADAPSEASAEYFTDVTRRFGLDAPSALVGRDPRATVGATYAEVEAFCRGADVLLDLSGVLAREELAAGIPVRAFVDLDPAFTQLWQAVDGIDMGLAGHTHFVTVGLEIGADGCPVPDCGVPWITTLQPVVLHAWPPAGGDGAGALTTIANWRGYGSVLHDGVHFGQKAHSMRELMDLPSRTEAQLVLALAIHPDERRDLDALHANGWGLVDPAVVAGTPDAYQRFVQGSAGEIGIAKSGYVLSRCGWFSDRSACYLASGRPVVAQDTGFSRHLPVGAGLLAFGTTQEAADAIATVRGDYARHAAAARALAEEHFDARRVLTRLLGELA